MDALAALTTRHSTAPAFLSDPGPDEQALSNILEAGASAPDHGRLRPWRFIVVRGDARERLGEVFAEALRRRDPNPAEQALEQERNRPLRAPLVIVVVARLMPDHAKIPEIEQIVSVGAAAQNILVAAHAQGFGAKLLTGVNAYDGHVKSELGLGPDDRLIGFIHIGTLAREAPFVPHADPREHTVEWQAPGAA
jgi:nitroreductase